MKFIVDYTSPDDKTGRITVDAEDDLDAEEKAAEHLAAANPDLDPDGWVIDSVSEAPMPRPSREQAEEAIGNFILDRLGEGPGFSLAEDGDKCWSFWIRTEDTTSYLHPDLSIKWYGTGWEPGCEDDEERDDDTEDQDRSFQPPAPSPNARGF